MMNIDKKGKREAICIVAILCIIVLQINISDCQDQASNDER